MQEVRTNKLFLVTYCTKDFVQSVLDRKISQILAFAFIEHDKDVYLNDVVDKNTGEIKHFKGDSEIRHIHIYIELYNSRLPSEIVSWFKCEDEDGKNINTLREYPYSCQSCIDYLTHKNVPEKYQYNDYDVISYGLKINDDGSLSANLSCDNTLDIIESLLAGATTRDLVKRFGREFVYHYQAYKSVAVAIRVEDNCNQSAININTEDMILIDKNKKIF